MTKPNFYLFYSKKSSNFAAENEKSLITNHPERPPDKREERLPPRRA